MFLREVGRGLRARHSRRPCRARSGRPTFPARVRIEWNLAAERAHAMAAARVFWLPIVIDATRAADAQVPAEFRGVQSRKLPGGDVSAVFGARADAAGRATVGRPLRGRLAWLVGAAAGLGLLATLACKFLPRETASTPAAEAARRRAPPTSEISAPPAVTLAVSGNSISVQPFENRSTEPDSAYFADGIQDEVIAGLSLLSKLRVVGSRNSVEVFRASKKPLPQIARELGVAWVLRGNVPRAAGNVTVNGQLIRGDADPIFRAKTFRPTPAGPRRFRLTS